MLIDLWLWEDYSVSIKSTAKLCLRFEKQQGIALLKELGYPSIWLPVLSLIASSQFTHQTIPNHISRARLCPTLCLLLVYWLDGAFCRSGNLCRKIIDHLTYRLILNIFLDYVPKIHKLIISQMLCKENTTAVRHQSTSIPLAIIRVRHSLASSLRSL